MAVRTWARRLADIDADLKRWPARRAEGYSMAPAKIDELLDERHEAQRVREGRAPSSDG